MIGAAPPAAPARPPSGSSPAASGRKRSSRRGGRRSRRVNDLHDHEATCIRAVRHPRPSRIASNHSVRVPAVREFCRRSPAGCLADSVSARAPGRAAPCGLPDPTPPTPRRKTAGRPCQSRQSCSWRQIKAPRSPCDLTAPHGRCDGQPEVVGEMAWPWSPRKPARWTAQPQRKAPVAWRLPIGGGCGVQAALPAVRVQNFSVLTSTLPMTNGWDCSGAKLRS